jgi:hypothetical protein
MALIVLVGGEEHIGGNADGAYVASPMRRTGLGATLSAKEAP